MTTAEPTSTGGAHPRMGARAWVMLLVLSGSIFLEGADLSMMAVALPEIGADLGLSAGGLQWVLSAYVLGYGGFVLLGGRLGDLLGRRRMFLAALSAFVVFSAAGGIAQAGWLLIAARLLTGMSAAVMTPVGVSIISQTCAEGPARNRAVLFYAGFAAGGFSLGLVLGGLLTEVGWRWTFFAPVLAAAVLLAVAPRVFPRDTPGERGGLDLLGAALLTTGMVLAVLAIVRAPDVAIPQTAGIALIAAAALAAFVAVERRAAAPLVRLALLRRPSVTRVNLAAALWAGSFVAFQFVTVLYLQELRDWSPVATGLALLPVALDAVLAPTITPWVVARFGLTRTMATGMALGVAGYALFVPIGADSGYAVAMLPTMVLIGLGFTLVYGPLTIAATDGVPDADQGLASGLFNTSFQLGAAVGLAVASALVVAVTGTGAEADPLAGYRAGLIVPVAGAVLALAVTLPGLRNNVRNRTIRKSGQTTPAGLKVP